MRRTTSLRARVCCALILAASGCAKVIKQELTWENASMKALEQGHCVDSQQALDPVSPKDRQALWYELASTTAMACHVDGDTTGVYEWGLAALTESESRFPLDPRLRFVFAKLLETGGDSEAAARKHKDAQALAEEILRSSSDSNARTKAKLVLDELSERP